MWKICIFIPTLQHPVVSTFALRFLIIFASWHQQIGDYKYFISILKFLNPSMYATRWAKGINSVSRDLMHVNRAGLVWETDFKLSYTPQPTTGPLCAFTSIICNKNCTLPWRVTSVQKRLSYNIAILCCIETAILESLRSSYLHPEFQKSMLGTYLILCIWADAFLNRVSQSL